MKLEFECNYRVFAFFFLVYRSSIVDYPQIMHRDWQGVNGAHGSGPNLGHHGGAGGDNGILQPATHELLRPRFIQVHGYNFSLLATCKRHFVA